MILCHIDGMILVYDEREVGWIEEALAGVRKTAAGAVTLAEKAEMKALLAVPKLLNDFPLPQTTLEYYHSILPFDHHAWRCKQTSKTRGIQEYLSE